MRKKYLSAALAATLLSTAAVLQAQPVEGGSYAPVAAAEQSESTCTGTVTDDDGEPLPGATVRVDGTTVATSTDVNGVFNLANVAKGAKITFTFVGCTPVTVQWNGTPLNVQLLSDDNSLEEVVVVGYGQQKKVNLTGSVSSINADKIAETRPITNVSQALAGLAAGVNVTSGSNLTR